MKKITSKVLVLLYALASLQCGSSVFNKLQGGQWVDRCSIEHKSVDGITDTETPDFMFLHKSGRYILFNDLGGASPGLPIIAKGSWYLKDNSKLVLVEGSRLVLEEDRVDSVTVIGVGDFFKHNKKILLKAVKMERFIGHHSDSIKLTLPPPGGATILKLTYHLFYPGGADNLPVDVVVEDQDGHQLWRKTLIFKHQKNVEDILLADMPEAIDLTELTFKIYSQANWVLKAKIYK
jgi:hypothetical protein